MLNRVLEITLLAIIFGFIMASVYVFFYSAISGSDADSFKLLSGAFFGAFYAFIFIRFGEVFTKVYERKAKHHNSLLRLQHYFNDCLTITSDNIFVADDFLRIFDDKVLSRKEPRIFFNIYHEYPIDKEFIIGLTNIEYINEIYSFNVGLKKLNDTLDASNRSYTEVRTAYIEKNIELETYIENVKGEKERCKQIKGFLLQTQIDTVHMFSIARVLSKYPPMLSKLIAFVSKTNYPANFESIVTQECDKLNSEIEKNSRESAKKIKSTMGNET